MEVNAEISLPLNSSVAVYRLPALHHQIKMCQNELVVLIQNLQKRNRLATELYDKYHPDIMLVQEINLDSETHPFPAYNTSSMEYGTAISSSSKYELCDITKVQSPHSEIGGFIKKKTTIATIHAKSSIEFVSFHGYNGHPFQEERKIGRPRRGGVGGALPHRTRRCLRKISIPGRTSIWRPFEGRWRGRVPVVVTICRWTMLSRRG